PLVREIARVIEGVIGEGERVPVAQNLLRLALLVEDERRVSPGIDSAQVAHVVDLERGAPVLVRERSFPVLAAGLVERELSGAALGRGARGGVVAGGRVGALVVARARALGGIGRAWKGIVVLK